MVYVTGAIGAENGIFKADTQVSVSILPSFRAVPRATDGACLGGTFESVEGATANDGFPNGDAAPAP